MSPVLAGVDVGPGIPLNVDASHPVIEGSIRYYNLPSPATPYIKWGLSTITFSGSTVLFDGVPRAGWSWNSTSQTLMAPGRHLYVFNSNGNLANSSGADGLQVTPHTYSASLPDRVTGVSDGFGTHGHTALKLGPQVPTYAIDRDGGRKVGFTYKSSDADGAGLFDTITVYKLNSSPEWEEQEHTTYTYDSSNRVTQVSTVDVAGTSTTNVTYSGTCVQRIENSQLKYDMTYDYSTTNNIETPDGQYHTFGVVTIRRRSTYGEDTDSSDQITKFNYYRDTQNGPNTYLFRRVPQVYDGSALSDYATTEDRCYRRQG